MRNLALSSILTFYLGCSPSPYLHLAKQEHATPCLRNLKPQFTSVLYTAQVNVTGKHLSGLLLFKTMTDSSIRTIFTGETGVTFFDFEFGKNSGFKVVSCIKQMNKKVVINKLKHDLGLLLMHGFNVDQPEIFASGNETYYSFVIKNERVYYVTDTTCNQLFRIETASKRHQKTLVNLIGYASGMPDSVYLAQQSFEYNITLKKIIR
jgi:hypothetical protein